MADTATMTRLPEKFQLDPANHSPMLAAYITRKYSTHGFPKHHAIEYNREHAPTAEELKANPYTINRYRWVEHPASNFPSARNGKDGLRFVGKAHDIRGSGDGNIPYFDRALVDHNGWYVNSFQDELATGEVYQLPADRDGKSRYVPAVSDPWNDGALIDFHSMTDDLTDAIRWADRMAERYAEDAREDEARERAKDRIEEIGEEIKTAYADLKTLCREIRTNCDKLAGLDNLKRLIRSEVRRVRASVRKLRRESAKLQNNFWESVPN